MDFRHDNHRRPSTPALAVWAALVALTCCHGDLAHSRTIDLTGEWKFELSDRQDGAEIAVHDFPWQTVRIPHDWAIAGPFQPKMNGYAGKLPWNGVGWYRRWVALDKVEAGSRVYLDFDGVMSSPQVFINGRLAGEWDYGYTPFRVDLTPHFRFGRANVIAVRVDNRKHGTRWYPGGGIYRKVTMTVSPPVHLSHHGTRVATPVVSPERSQVSVENEVESYLDIDQTVDVKVEVFDAVGARVGDDTVTINIPAGKKATTTSVFQLESPHLWDNESPYLYSVVTSLEVGAKVVERRTSPLGIRTVKFSPDEGFFLNGRKVELRGVNLHHDLGPLGVAFNATAMERRIRIMKDMGANAIRTSHNPFAKEFLELCDKHGILVWDELFDKWDETADRINGHPSFEEHLARHARSLVRRDRNHPSVVAWSIGNEILNQPHSVEGKSRKRVAYARRQFLLHDNSRPVGMGCHIPQTADSDILADLDFIGWNYQRRYANARAKFPTTPLVYSETASAVSTRGHYALPLPTGKTDYGDDGKVNAYELLAAPWADIPEVEFNRLKEDAYLAGEFVWTGFDYLGEPTPHEQNSRSSYFGIVDLVGFPKDRYYLYRSHWRPEETTIHVAPHWNWGDEPGQEIPVMVYTNGDSAELFVNGKSKGVRHKGVRPPMPANLLVDAFLSVSSSAPEHAPGQFLLERSATRGKSWRAAGDDQQPSIAADFGKIQRVKSVKLVFPERSKLYDYVVEASTDGISWSEVAKKPASHEPRWGGVYEKIHLLDVQCQHLRLKFQEGIDDVNAALEWFGAYEATVESEYYAPTYDYRLRWNEVEYEPGELKVVVTKDGQPIGERVVKTAGQPSQLRLSPHKKILSANGEDVSYVAVEAIDEEGNHCPFADDMVRIALEGPGRIAGVGNGDQTSLLPHQASVVQLFNGKAMIIVCAQDTFAGDIQLHIDADNLESATTTLRSVRP